MISDLGDVDVLLIPGDALYHILSSVETDALLTSLGARVVIPMHYRLPALETEPDSPSDLGEVGLWLDGRTNVRRLGGHTIVLHARELPDDPIILVFEHAPYLSPAGEL